jgi:large subunit ribosomal protein L17e
MFETANAVRGMTLTRALAYLKNVRKHKEIIPFRRYTRSVGRKAQCKNVKANQGRWPINAVNALIDLLKNAKANATTGEKVRLSRHHSVARAQFACAIHFKC